MFEISAAAIAPRRPAPPPPTITMSWVNILGCIIPVAVKFVVAFSVAEGKSQDWLIRLFYDRITELFYRREDVGDRGKVLDFRMTHANFDRVVVTEWVFLLTKFDDLLGQENGIDFLFGCFHVENGVMECWSIGVMGVKYYTP